MNSNTIKAAVRRLDSTVKVVSVNKFKFGVFSVKVVQQRKRSERIGIITGNWNGGSVELDKIDWV